MKKMSILFASALALSALVSRGELIAYESFGDAATTQLSGTTADSGLGAWTLVGGVAGSSTYTSPGLDYTNLATSGNKVTVTTGTSLYANLSSPFTVAANSTRDIWGSFVMNTANTSGDAALSIFESSNPTASTAALASIGMINNGNARLISGRTMDLNGNNGLATSSVATNQKNLYVFRITIDSNPGAVESGQFWINPTITSGMTVGDLGSGWSANFNNTGLSATPAITTISLYTTGTNAAVFDEIRLGTTLADVAVIPEPGTLALVGLALGALVLFRRRK